MVVKPIGLRPADVVMTRDLVTSGLRQAASCVLLASHLVLEIYFPHHGAAGELTPGC